MKGKTYYSIKDYSFEGNTLLKAGKKVKVIGEVKNNVMFKGDSEGMFAKKIFNSIFSPFQINQIVYHDFYGIGQIVQSNREDISAAVVFFSNPRQKFNICESEVTAGSLN